MASKGRPFGTGTYNPEFHPVDLIKRMSEGQTNVEIWADWDITERSFYKWLKEHEEFKEAYELAKPKWEKKWLQKGIDYMESGKRDAFKYWAKIMGIKGSKKWREGSGASNNTTNVSIGNMNILQSKSESELLEILQTKMLKLQKINPTLIEVIENKELKDKNDE